VLLVVDMPKLIKPPVATAEVTLTLDHDDAISAPELPTLTPKAGALAFVIVVSPHVVSATE
jgi:hypothetical protein